MSWKDSLAAIAPTIATAVGGPFAGAAAKFALDKLGFDAPEDPGQAVGELEQAVAKATPEQLATLKQIDNDFKVQMESLGIKREQMIIEDRQDARALAKLDMRPHMAISAIFITGYFTIAIMDGLGKFDIDDMIFGVITAAMPMLLQFWFGSSHGSKQKTHDASR